MYEKFPEIEETLEFENPEERDWERDMISEIEQESKLHEQYFVDPKLLGEQEPIDTFRKLPSKYYKKHGAIDETYPETDYEMNNFQEPYKRRKK